MKGVLLDTHAALWYLLGSAKLSNTALTLLDNLSRAGKPVYVSAISVLEVLYLFEKGRVPKSEFELLVETLRDPGSASECVPFDMATALAARQIPRDQVPDMPDRIVAATALRLGVPLITRDSHIRKSGVQTVW